MKRLLCGLLLLFASPAGWASDQWAPGKTADGSSVSYLLTTTGSQAYAVILMPGGWQVDRRREAQAYHGYNGIEQQTIEKIKAWIMAGG